MSVSYNKHRPGSHNKSKKALDVAEIYDPYLKISKYQEGEEEGTEYMKNITPGQSNKKNKIKIKEQRLPYLLMSFQQRQSLLEEEGQITFDGIQTKNFDMCANAYKEFTKLITVINSLPHEITGKISPNVRPIKLKDFVK